MSNTERAENEQAGGNSGGWYSWTWEAELQYVDNIYRTKVEIGDKITYHWISRNDEADSNAEIEVRNVNNDIVGHWNTEWMEPFSGLEDGSLKMEGRVMDFISSASPRGGTTVIRSKITLSSDDPGRKKELMDVVENPEWLAKGDDFRRFS